MKPGQTFHYWTMSEERIIQEAYRNKYYGLITDLSVKLNLPKNKVSNHIKDMKKKGKL